MAASENKAEAAYRTRIAINSEDYGSATFAAEASFEDSSRGLQPYRLDADARDTFLVHARQDVASTYAHAKAAFREAHRARRLVGRCQMRLMLLLLISAGVLAVMLAA